jgi:hypothetical protein
MGEVVDFMTGEPVKVGRIARRKDTVNIIESLYQRRHQIDDLIVIYNHKIDGQAGFGMACREDINRRILWTYFNDYMRDYSELSDD